MKLLNIESLTFSFILGVVAVIAAITLSLMMASTLLLEVSADWGNRSEYITLILGLPFAIGATTVTIWIAFRVERISNEQTDILKRQEIFSIKQNEFEVGKQIYDQIGEELAHRILEFTTIREHIAKTLVADANLAEELKLVNEYIDVEEIHSDRDQCQSCNKRLPSAKLKDLQKRRDEYQNALVANSLVLLTIIFKHFNSDQRMSIISKLVSENESKNTPFDYHLKNKILTAMQETDENTDSYNSDSEILDLRRENIRFLESLSAESQNFSSLLPIKATQAIVEIILLDWIRKASSEDKMDLDDLLSHTTAENSENLWKRNWNFKKELPKFHGVKIEGFALSNSLGISSNLISTIADASVSGVSFDSFKNILDSEDFDHLDDRLVEIALKRHFGKIRNSIENMCRNFSHIKKFEGRLKSTKLEFVVGYFDYSEFDNEDTYSYEYVTPHDVCVSCDQ
ncbi:hypothetical protein KBW81_03440 [Loktanella salsilacus]|jgi:hypothetical protein|uniref:hypothetical protein n=1 Tax=Loktanella salsilacus TaxID=195913 RepID=UPI0020B890DE|nr:hypothetical protein [Loktanella salsilacus]UTH48867.1 hypothetical protein KBW81_03440 [Loktanella salsilacus]